MSFTRQERRNLGNVKGAFKKSNPGPSRWLSTTTYCILFVSVVLLLLHDRAAALFGSSVNGKTRGAISKERIAIRRSSDSSDDAKSIKSSSYRQPEISNHVTKIVTEKPIHNREPFWQHSEDSNGSKNEGIENEEAHDVSDKGNLKKKAKVPDEVRKEDFDTGEEENLDDTYELEKNKEAFKNVNSGNGIGKETDSKADTDTDTDELEAVTGGDAAKTDVDELDGNTDGSDDSEVERTISKTVRTGQEHGKTATEGEQLSEGTTRKAKTDKQGRADDSKASKVNGSENESVEEEDAKEEAATSKDKTDEHPSETDAETTNASDDADGNRGHKGGMRSKEAGEMRNSETNAEQLDTSGDAQVVDRGVGADTASHEGENKPQKVTNKVDDTDEDEGADDATPSKSRVANAKIGKEDDGDKHGSETSAGQADDSDEEDVVDHEVDTEAAYHVGKNNARKAPNEVGDTEDDEGDDDASPTESRVTNAEIRKGEDALAVDSEPGFVKTAAEGEESQGDTTHNRFKAEGIEGSADGKDSVDQADSEGSVAKGDAIPNKLDTTADYLDPLTGEVQVAEDQRLKPENDHGSGSRDADATKSRADTGVAKKQE